MAGAEQNEDSFTFSGARSLARSFESGLVRMGAQAADVVAIVLPNMPQYALAFMGAAEAGFVITTLNPTYTSGEIKGQLMNGETKFIVTSKQLLPKVKDATEGTNIQIILIGDHHFI